MTPQQIRTVKRLGVALGIFVALVVWLLYTEGAAIVQGGHSTITEVVQLAWAHQPWVIFLLALVVVGIVAFLLGHFVAAPESHYERLRNDDWRLYDLNSGKGESLPHATDCRCLLCETRTRA